MAKSQGIDGAGPQLLIVDDEPSARRVLTRLLEGKGYRCVEVEGVDAALERLERGDIELVLTDLDMPGKSGLDLLNQIASEGISAGVIVVTGRGNGEIGMRAVEAGAYGYLSKPVQVDDVWVTVFNALRRRMLEAAQRDRERALEEAVATGTNDLWQTNLELERLHLELRRARDEVVERLARAAEHHDDETAAHVRRVSRYCRILARLVLEDHVMADEIAVSSVLHDIGKIAVPYSILFKPGPLTDEERDILKRHTETGHAILEGSQSEVLRKAATIALTHHEWFDGGGYPQRLAGEDIPLEGRIAAIADVFDALSTHRIYRRAFTLSETIDLMKAESGSHFDAALFGLFLDHLDEFLQAKHEVEVEFAVPPRVAQASFWPGQTD